MLVNLFLRFIKFATSEAHALISKFEDPVKLIEQGIRDLKKDFDDSMKSVAQMKAITIGTRKEIESKKQIAADYERKALILLKKAKNNELDEKEAERLAAEAIKKSKEAANESEKLSADLINYEKSLDDMNKKILQLKNKIKESENEYTSLKARALVAKTTKKVNKELSRISSDSTMAMIEEMKTKITAEENLAEAYGEVGQIETSIDDEINKAIGSDIDDDVQKSLSEMKQKLLTTSEQTDDVDELKKELE